VGNATITVTARGFSDSATVEIVDSSASSTFPRLTVGSLGTEYTGPRYALGDANVAQVFQNVGILAVDMYAAAFMGYARPSSSLCPYFLDECRPPKNPLSSSVLGLRLSGREIGAAVE